MADNMKVTLVKDKVTKNAVRYSDQAPDHAKNLYLTKTEVQVLGDPNKIVLTIEAA